MTLTNVEKRPDILARLAWVHLTEDERIELGHGAVFPPETPLAEVMRALEWRTNADHDQR